ncbi:TetR/AcrR family transcriptional regulator [Amycolatopsis acidicola]|uniref:TetR/AcrR family transcriptional regulator n=1 Tax=Amycolatopsis acidicola TaxID=2596893 RepID=A0A5N0UTK4_9PSEU|nr:TetR/AcrR family transcriptional regulator [Amycolatopsis acidicola]KAA9153184.1 TetR/AcrR family transcriptional regulator [Amycolatopsis acidicola]
MPRSAGSGRPRDPEVDRRVAAAAIGLFGAEGWSGFSIEAVAKRAGVGKASIYLRWPTKEALLLDAVRQYVGEVTEIEATSVREELIRLALQLFRHYLGDTGRAAMRLALDADRIPAVAGHWAKIRESQILAARAIVRRAIRRGELPEGTSVTLLLDTLCGAVVNHVHATPPSAQAKLADSAESYARDLVDFLLPNVS